MNINNVRMTGLRRSAFTLVELLVVLAIIAILASFALPAIIGVVVTARQARSANNAKQIVLALRAFAQDNDGQFPSTRQNPNGTPGSQPVSNANEAFAQLIPRYLPTEEAFYISKSRFSPRKPDERFSNPSDRLAREENAYAYVMNLSDTSPGTWPLVIEGFADAAAHTYSKQESDRGGVWRGTHAIVARADGSAGAVKLTNDLKIIGGPDGDDLLKPAEDWLSTDNYVVNPQ